MELNGEKKQSADSKTKGQKGKRMDLPQSHLCSNERKPPEDDRPQSWPGQNFSSLFFLKMNNPYHKSRA
jgi:hypothetical protein